MQGVQCGFKNRAGNFQVDPKFKDLLIDGYKLSEKPCLKRTIDQIED
jgi:hypothetical protein